MRVLQINAVYDVGSTGGIVRGIHELCLSAGIESYVAYSTSPCARKDIRNGYQIGGVIGKKMHAALSRINGMQAYFSKHATAALIRYIKKIRPDIVHLHNVHSNYLHLNKLLKFLEEADIMTVITLHDCWFYTGGCFHYTNVGCDRWLKECGNCPKKLEDTKAYFFDRSKRILADRKRYLGNMRNLAVVGVSQWQTDEAKRSFLGQKRCETIYNGINVDFFKPTESDMRKKLGIEDRFVVLGMANKWLAPVNRAALETLARELDEDSVLVIVGGGADRTDLPRNVISLDYIYDRDELRRIYSMADVFANCTREDALSLVNLEAQACGTPVVTYRNTGSKEAVDEQCSFTVETGNIDEMLEKLRYIKKVGKEVLTDQCRAFVKAHFERNNNSQKMILLYRELYKEKKSENSLMAEIRTESPADLSYDRDILHPQQQLDEVSPSIPKTMRVLQINATYGYGSTGLIVRDTGDTLTAAGEEAFFAYQSTKSAVPNGYCVGNRVDWKLHAVLCRLLGRQGYYSKSATRRFLRYLNKINPDVVHLHNLHSNFIHLNKLLKYLAKKDIPTVITMHDCWYFTGKCFHYVDVGCDGFQHACGHCPKKKASPASLLFDCSRAVLRDRIRYLSAIPRLKVVGCSDWICGEAKKGFMRDFSITSIRNGVDVNVFKPQDKQALKAARGLQDKFVVLGMANKWLLPSNRELLDRTVAMLDDGAVLMLVGCTDEQKAQLAPYSDKVVCEGFVFDRAQMAMCYATADVFVNATHADTLPTVNMESICCGTPVITYDSCGSPELVLEGCGYVVAENDVDAILEKIATVRRGDSWNCATIGAEHFDKNKSYQRYMDVYREIVKA